MRKYWMIISWLVYTNGIRIPLSYDTNSPFLRHSVNSKKGNSFNHESLVTFSWSNVFLGKLLHQSDIVEVGPRGVRFIQDVEKLFMEDGKLAISKNCTPTDLALCHVQSKEGWIFPSEGKWIEPVVFNIASNSSLLEDSIMRVFAGETTCHGESQGGSRAYTKTPVEYSVTSCDILYGKFIIVYHKSEDTVYIYPQSFGPIAYLLILLSATISTGAIAFLSKVGHKKIEDKNVVVIVEKQTPIVDANFYLASYIPIGINLNVTISILVCAVIFIRNKIHFHTEGDFIVFVLGIISGLFYEVIIFFFVSRKDKWVISMEIDGCLYALQTISIALYRTPENPYISILFFFMACRIWGKIFALCHGMNSSSLSEIKYIRYMDGILALINFNLISEFGMRRQYIFLDIWPIYFTLSIFISFCLVKYHWIQGIIQF